MLTGKHDSKCMQSLSHWCTSLLLIDLSEVTCGRLPSYRLDGWTTTQSTRAACRLMSALPRCCYVRHTFSLYCGTWIEMPASFLLMWPCVSLACRVQLLLIIIATADVSVSAETLKLIYCIYRYCDATSTHSPMSDIGLTLIWIFMIFWGCIVINIV